MVTSLSRGSELEGPKTVNALRSFFSSLVRLLLFFPSRSHLKKITLTFPSDVVWQISLQFPCSFEFNEQFLIDVADEMHFARTGTFLANTEKDRVEQKLPERTVSLWTVIFASKQKYTNSLFTVRTIFSPLPVSVI